MLKIVFMGSPEFAVPSLEALHNSSHKIIAVVTNPDKRRGRGGEKSPTIVKRRALDFGYPVLEAESARDPDFIRTLTDLKPDLIVVVAFRILPPEILQIPRLGSVNLHASLLPKYRGAAPIHWAVINGETETGCTVFFLGEKVDTGHILDKVKTDIGPDETAGDLYGRLKELGAGLLVETVDNIEKGKAKAVPQDSSKATPAPKLFTEDTRIDFHRSSIDVHNLIRGLSPFPGATALYGNEVMKLYRSRVGPEIWMEAGELNYVEECLIAGCGTGSVQITELQMPGKKRISGKDFANGYDLNIKLE